MAHQIPLEKPNNQNTPSLPLLQEPEEISQSSSNCMEQKSTSPKSRKNDEDIAMDGQDTAAGDFIAVDQEATNVPSDEGFAAAAASLAVEAAAEAAEESGRERLKRHRVEVAGQVWIPDIWGQEELLQDWIDCSAFDASLFPSGIMSARSALVEEGRRENSGRLRIENRC